jgi:hypothetical protein
MELTLSVYGYLDRHRHLLIAADTACSRLYESRGEVAFEPKLERPRLLGF